MRNNNRIVPFVLLLLGFIAYSNTFFSPFHFDDTPLIPENPAIQSFNIASIWSLWPTRFITNLSFAVNYACGGSATFGYHLVNFLIHLGAAMLVWLLALLTARLVQGKESQDRSAFAFLAAAIFLVHPLQTEAVTYIIQRATSLASFFYLASVCCYIKSRMREQEKGAGRAIKTYYLLSLVFALAAMYSKEIAVTLPFIIVLCEKTFFTAGQRLRWKRVWPFLVLIAVIPLTLLVTGSVDPIHLKRAQENAAHVSWPDYAATQTRVYLTYFRLLIAPVNQNLDYDYPVLNFVGNAPLVIACCAVIASVLALAFSWFRERRLLAFGIFWFFIALIAEGGLVPISDLIFEHRLYLPMAGFSLLLAGLLIRVKRKNLAIAVTAMALTIAAYSIITFNRNFVWTDRLSLANDILRKSPGKSRSYLYRGQIYCERKQYARAAEDFWTALRIFYRGSGAIFDRAVLEKLMAEGKYALIFNSFGVKYAEAGWYKVAAYLFSQALSLDPENPEMIGNLAGVLRELGRYREAAELCLKALGEGQTSGLLRYNLAAAYYGLRRYDLAIAQYDLAETMGYCDPGLKALLAPHRR